MLIINDLAIQGCKRDGYRNILENPSRMTAKIMRFWLISGQKTAKNGVNFPLFRWMVLRKLQGYGVNK